MLNRYMLDKNKLRTVLEYLWDGNSDVIFALTTLQRFKECHAMYLWLARNNIRGQSILDFFEEHGHLGAGQKILNYMSGRKFTKENITISDLK